MNPSLSGKVFDDIFRDMIPLNPLAILYISCLHVLLLGALSEWVWVSEVNQSCPTLSDPMDCSPPGSSVHGILQARILEWVAISFSRGSSQPRDWTQVSRIVDRRFNLWTTREATVLWGRLLAYFEGCKLYLSPSITETEFVGFLFHFLFGSVYFSGERKRYWFA